MSATEAQLNVHKDPKKKRIVWGGNRSGKSRVGATECVWWATGTHPYRATPKPCRIWAVGLDYPTVRDGIKPMYFDVLLPKGEYKWWQADQLYEITKGPGKGSIIGLKSCDSGREKFQSVTRDFIWLDEEAPEEIFNECLARLLDVDGSLIMTFTPLEGLTWSYRRLFLNESSDPQVSPHRLRTIDNPIFGGEEEAKKRLASVYTGLTQEELEARLVGDYIPLAGRPVFDRLRLSELRKLCVAGTRGELRNSGTELLPKWEFVTGAR